MKDFQTESDVKWMSRNPKFQAFKNFAFEGKTVFVTKDWVLKNVDADLDLEDGVFYETTLSIGGFHNVEKGIYGVEIKNGQVEFADTSKNFKILLVRNWVKVRPNDHKGYYKDAKQLGY